MPLKYNPDTGIPSYQPIGIEIEEGVTPPVTVIEMDTKAGVFAGDRSPWHRRVLKPIGSATPFVADQPVTEEVVDAIARAAKPAKLNAKIATDAEVDEIEKLAKARQIKDWPLLLRLVNRLRRAERG